MPILFNERGTETEYYNCPCYVRHPTRSPTKCKYFIFMFPIAYEYNEMFICTAQRNVTTY